MSAWPTKKLNELCRPRQWPTLSKSEMNAVGVPVYGANGIIGFTDTPTHVNQVILIGCRGSCGTVHLLQPPAYANGNAMALDDLRSNLIDLKFLEQYLRHRGFADVTTGASQPQIVQRNLNQIEIPLPPLDEQQRIASILDQAEELRRMRQCALDRLHQLGQTIFHEMFGDSTSNPKNWKTDSLGSIVRKGDKINYGVVQPGDDVEDGVPLIRVGDLIKPFINPSEIKHISAAVEANYKRSRLAGDEILIGCVGSIGTVALAHAGLKGANIARAVARVPVNSDLAEREFVAEMIRSPLVQRYFAAETRTVAQPTLNISLIVSAPIFVPPLELQKEFVARISALRAALTGNGKSSASLDELLSSLQHRAFRGEL